MDNTDLDRLIEQRLDALLPKKLAELREKQTPSLCIIATKGTLDWAYPPSSCRAPPRRSAGTSRCSSRSTGSTCCERT